MRSPPRAWLVGLLCVYFLNLILPCDSNVCDVPPIEEGHQGTIVCNAPSSASSLIWFLVKDGKEIAISSCSVQSGCTDLIAGFQATNSSSATFYISVLKILNASRTDSLFKCVANGGVADLTCSIEIYVKPETPSCNSPVVYSRNEIAISCNTSRVYPEAKCMFTYFSQSFLTPVSGPVAYENTPSVTSPADFATVCTLIMDVTGYKSGDYQLGLQMFPTLSKVPQSAAVIQDVPVISLRAPSVNIGADCPKGPSLNRSYIESSYGSQTTCRCELADEGVPHGQALWYDKNGSRKGDTNATDGSSTINLSFNPNDPNPSYECRASTALNTTITPATYRPQFAIGPNLVNIDISDASFDICPSNKQNITVMCTVPASQVNPEPTFSISIDSQLLVERRTGQLTSSGYVYSYAYRPQFGGKSASICTAENSVFPNVKSFKAGFVSVREPPKTDPQITVSAPGKNNYSNNVDVNIGDGITVSCVVNGGSPGVDSVTLQCGNKTANARGNRALLTLIASQTSNGQICFCKAKHVTNCYSQVAEITLSVKIGSAEPNIPKSDNLGIIVGLSVGIGLLALISAITIFLVIRRRRARGASRPPTYVAEWVNKPSHQVPAGFVNPPSYSRYVTPPPYTPPNPPNNNDYAEIIPTYEHIYTDANDHDPPMCYGPRPHTNAGFMNDYIQPIA